MTTTFYKLMNRSLYIFLVNWKNQVNEITSAIEAKKEKKDVDNLIHQGIASRSVLRKFTLSEYVKVDDADFKDGMLKIKLYEDLPEEKKLKTIKIK